MTETLPRMTDCPACPAEFTDPDDLTNHLRTHPGCLAILGQLTEL